MSNSVRVMHFADTHFGVENYGRLDSVTGMNTRLLDFKKSLTTAIDMAFERGVQLAIFAGDAYKGRDPNQTHQREFAQCIRKLTDRRIPVVLLTGNHDIPNVRGRAHSLDIYRSLGVENVTVINRPETHFVQTSGGKVNIAGLPYLMKGFTLAKDESSGKSVEEVRDMIEKKYADNILMLSSKVDPGLPTIFMGHFWVRKAKLSNWQTGYFQDSEPKVALSDIARTEFDYVALGHIHGHQDLNVGAYPPVVYSGSPDTIDFGERNEIKGFVMVDLVKGATTYEFVPIPGRRPFWEIDVDADTDDPTNTILGAIARKPLENAIVRLTYHISAERQALVDDRSIRDALAQAFMLVSYRRDIKRDRSTRSKSLTESLEPRLALESYIDMSEKLKVRKVLLMEYADRLFDELHGKDAVK